MFRVHTLSLAAIAVFLAAAAPRPSDAIECTFYVRQGFEAPPSANPGETPATAFGSISEGAAAVLNPGDVVCVGPGRYEEGEITPARSGIEGRPIEFFADTTGELTGDPPGTGVRIVAPAAGPCGAPGVPTVAFSLLGHHHIVIDGFTILGFCDAAIQVRSSTIFVEGGDGYFRDNNAHDVTIRNNAVVNSQKIGIDVSAEGSIVIEGNEIVGCGESGISIQSCVDAPDPDAPIDLPPRCRAGPSEPVTPSVSNNQVTGNAAHGVFVRDAEGGLLQNNIVSDNASTGITLRTAPDVTVVNNLVVRNGQEGLAVGSAELPAPNVRIVNNTFYANGEWGIEIGSGGATSPGAIVLNNIVQANGQGHLGIGVLNESLPPLTENLRSTCGYVAGFNLVGDEYGPKTPHNLYDSQDDPLFVDAATNDFRLQPGSPAIDGGSALAIDLGLTGSASADRRPDTGRIDVGFHYGADPEQVIEVTEPFMPVYVRAAGNDTNDGTSPAEALATITAGARRARAGVTVVVGPGRYPECVIEPPADQGKAGFLAASTGTLTQDRPGVVLVDAGACATPIGHPGFHLVNACYASVDGFYVRGAFDDGVQVQTGSHFASVRNNVSFSNGRRGINVINAHDVQIVNNLVYDNEGGIQIGGTCTQDEVNLGLCGLAGSPRAVIHGNTSYGNAFTGILIGAGGVFGGVSDHASVRYNVLANNGENGIQVGNNDVREPHLEGFVEASGFNVLSGNPKPYAAGTPGLASDLQVEDLEIVDPDGADDVLGGDRFADDNFCLSQIDAGQAVQSEVIDYSDVTAEMAAMSDRSTRTDGFPDEDNLDPGFHYVAHFSGLAGDCDDDGKIAVSELIVAVRIALAASPMIDCASVDVDFNGRATIDEVVGAIGGALGANEETE